MIADFRRHSQRARGGVRHHCSDHGLRALRSGRSRFGRGVGGRGIGCVWRVGPFFFALVVVR